MFGKLKQAIGFAWDGFEVFMTGLTGEVIGLLIVILVFALVINKC